MGEPLAVRQNSHDDFYRLAGAHPEWRDDGVETLHNPIMPKMSLYNCCRAELKHLGKMPNAVLRSGE